MYKKKMYKPQEAFEQILIKRTSNFESYFKGTIFFYRDGVLGPW